MSAGCSRGFRLTLIVIDSIEKIATVVGTDETQGSIMDTEHSTKIGQPSSNVELLEKLDLTRHAVGGTLDHVIGKGTSNRNSAVLDDQVESVIVLHGVGDSTVELGRGQGSEESEVIVDLVVFVRQLNVVLPKSEQGARG